MKHYLETTQKVFEEVASSETGLSQQEAEQRLAKHGQNKLDEAKKTSVFVKFLKQLVDPMIIVLLVAAVVSLVTVLINNANPQNPPESFADVIIIVVVVLLNAILGVVQESKAEQAIEALQSMTESTCKVLRNGVVTIVKSHDVTVGDVVILEAGDSVPADCRIVECASLKVEESALTGESVPSEKFVAALPKDVALGDRKNMLYLGSTVVYGRAKAVVVAVGMNTEMGKIANVLNTAKEEKTPLQIKMASLSKILTFIVIGICVVIFATNLIIHGFSNPQIILDSFMVAISLAVASIPEGLATVVTIVLSIGVTNMSKKNAVIRKLTAVETLGCAQIICSDKTGTLTQNKMTVVDTFTFDEQLLATSMALCSDATLVDNS
ncbi:MAG: cation-translocating P-type ATPase, partial [Candidatus Fimimonas sp.]